MLQQFTEKLTAVADFLCGYPLFVVLIVGGLYLFARSGMVSLRRLPAAVAELRRKSDGKNGQISSLQALLSVVAATVGLGNIAGVAIALVLGGPGAIFWMWVSACVGMSTKFHEGVLAVMYRHRSPDGSTRGGPMYIIEHGLGPRWRPLAVTFAVAGMFGTLCIMNANQLAEGTVTLFSSPEWVESNSFLHWISSWTSLDHYSALRLLAGITIALIVALVVLGGIRRIARVATVLVPFMVGIYMIMVFYIILTHLPQVPGVIASIFREAFNFRAGLGALAGIAIIGARRAALVNDAGVGTASIMHGESKNDEPVREGLVAMLGPSIDSGLVCTLTAIAILLCGDIHPDGDVQGLSVAMGAFGTAIPGGEYLLMLVVICFGLSSMFSYSFYGNRCATYLFGERRARFYTYLFILSLILFAVVPLKAAVGLCDLFYALMAFPTMLTVLLLSGKVREATRSYFSKSKNNSPAQ